MPEKEDLYHINNQGAGMDVDKTPETQVLIRDPSVQQKKKGMSYLYTLQSKAQDTSAHMRPLRPTEN